MNIVYWILGLVASTAGAIVAIYAAMFICGAVALVFRQIWKWIESPVEWMSLWLIRVTCPLFGIAALAGSVVSQINGKAQSLWESLSMLILGLILLGIGVCAWTVRRRSKR